MSGCASSVGLVHTLRPPSPYRDLVDVRGSREAPRVDRLPLWHRHGRCFRIGRLVRGNLQRNDWAIERKKRRNTSRLPTISVPAERARPREESSQQPPGRVQPAAASSRRRSPPTRETKSGNIGVVLRCESLRGPGEAPGWAAPQRTWWEKYPLTSPVNPVPSCWIWARLIAAAGLIPS